MDQWDKHKLRVSTGTRGRGKVNDLLWASGELRARLAKPAFDKVYTLDQYVRLTDVEQSRLKKVGCFEGGCCIDAK